jgi:hypothetical protein
VLNSDAEDDVAAADWDGIDSTADASAVAVVGALANALAAAAGSFSRTLADGTGVAGRSVLLRNSLSLLRSRCQVSDVRA